VSVAGGLTAEIVVRSCCVGVPERDHGRLASATLGGRHRIDERSRVSLRHAAAGASMNPARSLGPAFVRRMEGSLDLLAGPLVGRHARAVAHHSLARGNGRH